jgi:hypothetical protein
MGNVLDKSRKPYPASLRCAAEAVFGPDARLSRLINPQPISPATTDKPEKHNA